MGYLGKLPATQGKDAGPTLKIDDISGDFNGSKTAFDLKIDGTGVSPHINNIQIYLSGVHQQPTTAFTLAGSSSGSQVRFTSAPSSEMSFHGALIGDARLMTPDNDTVEPASLTSGTATTISGSFTSVSSSIAADVASNLANRRTNTTISGSFTSVSASIAADVATNLANRRTDTTISGSTTSLSSSVASDIAANIVSITNNSSSFASRYTNQINQDLRTSASPTFVNTTVTGTLTAQEIHTEFESASILFTSGSTILGNSSDDVHNVTGSMNISGSLFLKDGTLTVTDNVDFNGDLDVDGTTNLDVVDIDGAVDMASTLDVGGHLSASANVSIIKGNAMLHIEELNGSKGYLFSGGSFTALRTTSNTKLQFGANYSSADTLFISSSKVGIGTDTFFSDDYSHLSIRGNASDGVSGLSFQVAGTNGSARNFSITANNSANGALDIRMSNANNNTPNTNRLLTLDINSKLSLSNNDAGTNNTIFGASAGASIQSGGQYNTLFGASAGTNITTADQNTLYGYQCGDALVGGSYNVAMGVNTLGAMTSGGENVAIGNAALASNVSGLYNVVVGQEAMYAAAGSHADNGEDANVAVGYKAMQNVNAGSNQNALVRGNVAIGYLALQGGDFGSSDLNLDYNIAIGANALNSTGATEHNNTVAIGRDAGTAINNTDASGTTLVGALSGVSITRGRYNTAIGYSSLYSNTEGDKIVAIGYECAEDYNPTADYGNSVFIGYQAAKETTTARKATVVGDLAVASGIMTGHENTVIGHAAGYNLTASSGSTAIGVEAMSAATDGNFLIAIGYQAMKDGNVRGGADNSIAIGYRSLNSLTTGNGNLAIGRVTGYSLTTGAYNVMIGDSAGSAFHSTSTHNTLVGYSAGASISAAGDGNNVCVGSEAGIDVTSGTGNVIIGASAGRHASGGGNVGVNSGDNNILLGKFARPSAADGNSEFVVGVSIAGQGNSKFTFGYGSSYVGLTAGSTTVFSSSDKRIKKNIKISEVGLSFINDLKPVTYEFKEKGELEPDFVHYEKDSTELVKGKKGKTYHGFIAQEVKEVIDKHDGIQNGFDGWNENKVNGEQHIGESAFIPMLVKAVQELSQKNEALEKRIEELEN